MRNQRLSREFRLVIRLVDFLIDYLLDATYTFAWSIFIVFYVIFKSIFVGFLFKFFVWLERGFVIFFDNYSVAANHSNRAATFSFLKGKLGSPGIDLFLWFFLLNHILWSGWVTWSSIDARNWRLFILVLFNNLIKVEFQYVLRHFIKILFTRNQAVLSIFFIESIIGYHRLFLRDDLDPLVLPYLNIADVNWWVRGVFCVHLLVLV